MLHHQEAEAELSADREGQQQQHPEEPPEARGQTGEQLLESNLQKGWQLTDMHTVTIN